MHKNERFVFKGTKWVIWHIESEPTDPAGKHEGFMCDYHFRVALACRMVERYGLGQAEGPERECFFCKLPDGEV